MSAASHSRDQAVQSMFDRIAGRYDLLNRVISFRLDTWWRAQAIRTILNTDRPLIVDLGTGTGDLAFNAAQMTQGRARIIGLDFSMQMVRLAQTKRAGAKFGSTTAFIQASAMSAPLQSLVFDGAMSAFVLRNISDLSSFFTEAFRMLKPGGKFVSLDMFPPSAGWFATFYAIYFYSIMPWIGGLISRDRNAYQYLSDSVRNFHSPEAVAEMIKRAGFVHVSVRKFLNGAVCMHLAEKPGDSLSKS
jgi:demethylmenaquinone methyltransferase/2-methoxy-6-polyprenyl-1,4-benzoquinol methylase